MHWRVCRRLSVGSLGSGVLKSLPQATLWGQKVRTRHGMRFSANPTVPPLLASLVVAAAMCSRRHDALLNKITNPGSPELKLIVRLDESAAVFDQIMTSVDQGVPRDILDGAACVVIIPGVQTYSLVVGAE